MRIFPGLRVRHSAVAAAVACSVLLAGASATAGAQAAAGGGAALTGTWGSAQQVLGIAALNQGGNAYIASVSCASAGNCGAGGYYTDSAGHQQVWVVSEANGTWGTAQEVPATASLNKGGNASIASVSCRSAGNCSAGGHYTDSAGHSHAFVVSEVNGTWGTAQQVAGTAAPAAITSVSCGSAGNCSAGGSYTDSSGHQQAWVVSEANGTWGTAQEAPGTASLNKAGNAAINSVSCPSAGNCSAGGFYTVISHLFPHSRAFVVGEANGTWGTAEKIVGPVGQDITGRAQIGLVSCASAGNCTAGGDYETFSAHPFVVGEANGTWGTAQGISNTISGADTELQQLSCGSAGNCIAGGLYHADNFMRQAAWVDAETNGTWGNLEEVSGTGALNRDKSADTASASCASAGTCGAGGYYTDSSGQQAWVDAETNGTWGRAEEVPGAAALNTGGHAAITSVSCTSASHCSAGGYYKDSSGHVQVFVVGET